MIHPAVLEHMNDIKTTNKQKQPKNRDASRAFEISKLRIRCRRVPSTNNKCI
jgi:hypothetical protein